MKKKILSFILAFALIIPCAFMLAGCGEGQFSAVSIDTRGNYAQATAETKTELTEKATAAGINENFGYKMTMKYTGEDGFLGKIELNFTMIVTVDENKNINGIAAKIQSSNNGGSGNTEIYLKDGYYYVNANSNAGSMKIKTQAGSENDYLELMTFGRSNVTSELIAQLYPDAEDSIYDNNVTVSKAEGRQTKYKITITEDNAESYTYIIFEGDKFVGAKMEAEGMEVNIAAFNGTISYPGDLNSYA